MLTLAAPASAFAQRSDDAELASLIDAADNPLPVLPVAAPELQTARQVEDIVASGNRPTLFQVSQPSGRHADPAKIRLFQLVALEYPLKVNFRKVAAGSPAAARLFDGDVSKPVYILCDPSTPGQRRLAFIDEAKLPAGREVRQTTIETFIYQRLGVAPSLLTTAPLTAAEAQGYAAATRPGAAAAAAPSRPMLALFFGGGASGPVNRVRALLALERFFYGDRLRIAESDAGASAEAYGALLQDAGAPGAPPGPELWLFDPVAQTRVKYQPGLAVEELTAARLQAWLAANGVPEPPDRALDVEAAWRELAKAEAGERR